MKRLGPKEIQYKELEILKIFDSICQENNLRYSLCGGTLLGAVRHKGFIPWDDDIDVMMPRTDFMKFMDMSKEKLPVEYKFVTPYNDSNTVQSYGKLYDLRTTLIEFPQTKRIPSHLYIDIFPIDGLPSNDKKAKKHMKKAEKRILTLYGFKIAKYKIHEKMNVFKKLFWYLIAFANKLVPKFMLNKRIDKLVRKYDYDRSSKVAVFGGYGEREIMSKETYCFDKKIEFEDCVFSAMNGYDTYLKKIYGDYMTLPPEDQRVIHNMEVYSNEG